MGGKTRETLEQVGRDLAGAKHAIAFTGAGISTESGIPDFRGKDGLWTQNKRFEDLAHIDAFHETPAEFWDFYRMRLDWAEGVEPNDAHRALALLEGIGILKVVITQNTDGLHHDAGSRTVLQLHGTSRFATCLKCRRDYAMQEARERLAQSADAIPYCDCGYALKPSVTLFGEHLPTVPLQKAVEHAEKADLVMCLGSTLAVYPAASIPQVVLNNGGKVIIINTGETEYDHAPGVIKIDAPLGETMQAIVGMTEGERWKSRSM